MATQTDIDFIIAFESGEATDTEIVEGFAKLVESGVAWQLQGFYGRTAQSLIDNGYINTKGEILQLP